jgi:serine/threonine protein kinase
VGAFLRKERVAPARRESGVATRGDSLPVLHPTTHLPCLPPGPCPTADHPTPPAPPPPRFAKRNEGRSYTLCGPPQYLAPEMVEGTGHTEAVDFWALGVLIYHLLSGQMPFAGPGESLWGTQSAGLQSAGLRSAGLWNGRATQPARRVHSACATAPVH